MDELSKPGTDAALQLPAAFPNMSSGDSFCYSSPTVYYLQVVDNSWPYAVNSTLNGLLAIVAIFTNILAFNAIRRTTSIRQPSKLLLLNLVLTDLAVGFAAQPQFVIFLVAKLRGNFSISCFSFQSNTFVSAVLTCASMLTMASISVDRYLAFFSHLRHPTIVTSRKVSVLLVFFWVSGVLFAAMIYYSEVIPNLLAIAGISACFGVISLAYIKIYRGLRQTNGRQSRNRERGTPGGNPRPTLNVARYRKILSSMLWLYGLVVVCYAPLLLMRILLICYSGGIIYCLYEFSLTFMFLNSCLNPFVYFCQVREIRAKVLQDLRTLCTHNIVGFTS